MVCTSIKKVVVLVTGDCSRKIVLEGAGGRAEGDSSQVLVLYVRAELLFF
jgi:hypothetical protein